MSMPNSYPISIFEADCFLDEVYDHLTPEELSGLKTYLAGNPEAGVVVSGTNGVRKLRWGQKSKNVGKRGGVRVIYYYRDLNMPLFLLAVYAKGQQADLTAKKKKELKLLIGEVLRNHSEQASTAILELVVSNY